MQIEIEDLKKVNLNPNDIVIIKFPSDMTMEALDIAFEHYKNSLPFPNNKTVLLGNGATIEVISPILS